MPHLFVMRFLQYGKQPTISLFRHGHIVFTEAQRKSIRKPEKWKENPSNKIISSFCQRLAFKALLPLFLIAQGLNAVLQANSTHNISGKLCPQSLILEATAQGWLRLKWRAGSRAEAGLRLASKLIWAQDDGLPYIISISLDPAYIKDIYFIICRHPNKIVILKEMCVQLQGKTWIFIQIPCWKRLMRIL